MEALPQESTRSCSTILQASDGESWGTGSPPTATDRVGASELKTVLLGHGASGGTCQSQSHVALGVMPHLHQCQGFGASSQQCPNRPKDGRQEHCQNTHSAKTRVRERRRLGGGPHRLGTGRRVCSKGLMGGSVLRRL